jgi:TonB family protein
MNEFTVAILLVTLLSASAQDSKMEDRAVFRVQQTPASRYDTTLPNRPFVNWLNQIVGQGSGVSWRLGECVELSATTSEREQGVPACVEATAILPDDRNTDEPPPTPSPPRVSKAVAGYALTKVAAIYPPIAKQMKASGSVQVAITIDENGLVIEAKAISGHHALRSSAEEAAKKWVFRPASLDGKPMRQRDVLTFTFQLPQ